MDKQMLLAPRSIAALLTILSISLTASNGQTEVGSELAIPHHLQDGDEFNLPMAELVRYGRKVFEAHFTSQEGAGRPLTKGTGAALADPNSPLRFPQNNNRASGPESKSCAGCHNQPIAGGVGDLATNVFVLGQRFDFATFNANDTVPTGGTVDERGMLATLQSIANSRSTPDMFGSGYYEMVVRQITHDLQKVGGRLQCCRRLDGVLCWKRVVFDRRVWAVVASPLSLITATSLPLGRPFSTILASSEFISTQRTDQVPEELESAETKQIATYFSCSFTSYNARAMAD
jgi:hypothetical protein